MVAAVAVASTPARERDRAARAGGGQSTSGAVTDTVNKTVSGVDEATGGVIGSTGVTEVDRKSRQRGGRPGIDGR